METQFENKTLENISNIYDNAKDCLLIPEVFNKVNKELCFLSEKLQISQKQAFLFAVIFTMDLEDEGVSINQLGKFLKCTNIKLLNFSSDLEYLKQQEILHLKKTFHSGWGRKLYTVTKQVKEAVLKEEFPVKPSKTETNSLLEVLETFYNEACKCNEKDIESFELYYFTIKLLESNKHFLFVQKLLEFEMDIEEECLFLYLSWKALTGNESVDMSQSIEGIIQDNITRIKFSQSLISGTNVLIKQDLIEIIKAGFLNSSDLKLTDKGMELLEEEGLKIYDSTRELNILLPEDITEKKLFYVSEDFEHIRMLEQTLEPAKLKEIRNRLTQNKLPKGITVILHGPPGTGKTESVYQLARRTGRGIVRVDISETKSKWYGDSEKQIKKIFTQYTKTAKKNEQLPILLFNEADAILSKRKSTNASSIDQTENAIQNILLEELEKFEGIFIATTNLVGNLDTAFERRFLFKILLQKPTVDVKQKIWKNRLKFLNDKECKDLAMSYELSGGEIENICRKILMQDVISGIPIKFTEIKAFCKAENYKSAASNNIGFKKLKK